MFLGLNLLKSDDLGSKRRNLGFKRSEKGQKDPWDGCSRASRRPELTETKDPMGERNPLVKSHIPGDEIHRKILKFQSWNSWILWRC